MDYLRGRWGQMPPAVAGIARPRPVRPARGDRLGAPRIGCPRRMRASQKTARSPCAGGLVSAAVQVGHSGRDRPYRPERHMSKPRAWAQGVSSECGDDGAPRRGRRGRAGSGRRAAAARSRRPAAASTSTPRTTASAPTRSKYDQQIRVYGKDSVQVGMGIADMDFRAAPSITKALKERLQHENWGYLDMPATSFTEGIIAWNKRRYGVDHRAVAAGHRRRRAPGAHRHAEGVLAQGHQGAAADADLQRLLQRPDRQPDAGRGSARSSSPTAGSRWTSSSSRSRSASTPTRSSSATRRTRPATAGAPRT